MNTKSRLFAKFVFPAALLASVLIILMPLPGAVMDMLLSFNLALAVLILLTTIFVRNPLEFSSFPSILLAATLFRLGLNIATTRLILGNAARDGELAAGQVVQTFSSFVTNGNLVVGCVIFLIVLIIQFVVITKGATRISEVSARFVLDGLPGKQSAIDADIHSGALTPEEGARQRAELADAVDFYGAMDGASKFVRGDAIAGLCITLINIIGGFAVGMCAHMGSFGEIASLYTRLTIGDGLVSQLPAFLIAIAAALLVTRSSRSRDLSEDVLKQMFAHPAVLVVTALFIVLLAFTQLPKVPLGILASGCLLAAWVLESGKKRQNAAQEQAARTQKSAQAREIMPSEAIQTTPLELEIGSAFTAQTELILDKIAKIRRETAHELGFLLPNVRIGSVPADCGAGEYRIKIHGSTVAEGSVQVKELLAVETPLVTGPLDGLQTRDPATGVPAFWISSKNRKEAQEAGYTVFSALDAILQHFKTVAHAHAPELLTRDGVQALLDELSRTSPVVVRDLVPEKLTLPELHRVLQRLLSENVSIRALGFILETLSSSAERTRHTARLAESVREALGRAIVAQNSEPDGSLHVFLLAPALEEKISQSFEFTDDGNVSTFLSPSDCEHLSGALSRQVRALELLGQRAAVLTSPNIRAAVREILVGSLPQLAVLSLREVPRRTHVDLIQTIEG